MTRIWTGTVTVENANPVVTVLVGDPLSDANAPADGSVMLDGLGYFIKQRLSNSSFELTRPYAGADATVVCEIDPLTTKAISLFNVSRDITAYNARLALLEADGKGLFYTLRGPTGAADPGPGKLARNEDDWAAVTELYIDVIDAANMLATPLIDAWEKGTIVTVRSIATRAFASYRLAGVPTNEGPGAWRKLASLTFLGVVGVLADDEDVAVEWNRGGVGLEFDHAVDNLAGRVAYDAAAAGTRVLVADTGAGRAAIYVKRAGAGIWSAPAYVEGPKGDQGGMPELTFLPAITAAPGAPAAVTASPVSGGYEVEFTVPKGDPGMDGASQFNRVRAVATGNINLAAPGAAIDTVAMTAGQTFLAAGQTAPAQNGPYVWNGAAVAATRVPALSTYDAMPGVGFRIMEGATKADTTWFCNSNLGGTLGTTALTFAEQVTSAVIASQAEAVAGSENTKSMSPLRVRHVLDGSPLSGYRNKLINGDFDIWQRGVSFSPVNGAFSADRFALLFDGTGATRAITRQSHTLGQTDVPGNPKYFLRFAQSIAGSGATYNALINKIEGVATLSGRDVTITFYAKAAVATSVAVQFIQYFGSGGSPSATVFSALGPHSVGTSWTKIAVKYTLPSVAGKTLGTSGNDYLAVEIGLPINVVSTVDLSRISLVDGDATGEADPFAPRPWVQELALCKRYYKLNEPAVGITNTTTLLTVSVAHHPPMRATPTVALVDGVAAVIDIGTNYRDASSVIEADYGGPDGTICRLTIATSTDNHVHAVRGQRISFVAEL